jgi:beta-lactam-binding protein with PASTA domain
MKRFFKIFLAGLAMFTVALLAASITLRLTIHGREVVVPKLEGKSDTEAAAIAKDLGLNLSVENRFYSAAVPANNVLSQSPSAGSRVRRGWQVRVTESLGGQKVAVPDTTGQSERTASLVLRRQQLELGTVVHLPAPGPSGVVLAQSPPPNTVGLNGPRVALLVSDDDSVSASASFVMPSITGMTLGAASARLATAGLHIASAQQPEVVAPTPASPEGTDVAAVAPPVVVQPAEPAPVDTNAVIVSQSPAAGHKVTRADSIRVTLGSSGTSS